MTLAPGGNIGDYPACGKQMMFPGSLALICETGHDEQS